MKLSAPVSVSFTYDSKKGKVSPKAILWNNRLYAVTKVGLHHTFHRGNTLFHVFSVMTPTLFFRLILDTSTLHWKAEEIEDNLLD